MIIGIPTEIKAEEGRVSCTPGNVSQFVGKGHSVLVQEGAGLKSGFSDDDFKKSGAKIMHSAEEIWQKADMIYKVKEPIKEEYKYLRENLIIYTYLHLAPNEALTKNLVTNKCIGIAFETISTNHELPLLKPMSEVAGRMAVQEAAQYLTCTKGGKGLLIGGVPGVAAAKVTVIGAGVAGSASVNIAVGMGAQVTVLDVDIDKLSRLNDLYGNKISTLYSNHLNISNAVKASDLIISTVLIPGAKAPKLITNDMLKSMKKGGVLVDISIDQGGSTEITADHPTTHANPIFDYEGITVYSVANIPGAVPMTSTHALADATIKYGLLIADKGWKEACRISNEVKTGVNTAEGYVTYKAVADALGYDYKDLDEFI